MSLPGQSVEKQISDYTRRGHFGNIAGRGFDPRRLHFYADLNLIQVGFFFCLLESPSVGQAVPDMAHGKMKLEQRKSDNAAQVIHVRHSLTYFSSLWGRTLGEENS